METVHVIRHKHLVEGKSLRKIAREMGIHRNTVKEYLAKSEPVRAETNERAQPVMRSGGRRSTG